MGGCWRAKREQQRPVLQSRGCSEGGTTNISHTHTHTHMFSRGAACQLPSVYFELLAVDISLDYFSYGTPNRSKGTASEL